MGLLDGLKKALGRQETPAEKTAGGGGSSSRPQTEEEIRVPEVTTPELLAEMREDAGANRLLLDCREPFERAQGFVPGSLHIPMNSIPTQLSELDRDKDIVVICAHGNRSYGVAGWLIQQGFRARSLKGGIVDWQHKGGAVETPLRNRP